LLSRVAAISGLYDGVVGALLLFVPSWLAAAFGVPAASPRIFSDLNGLFLLAVGAGYFFPWREPDRYRGYMWVMGPWLKGAGAVAFVLDHVLRHSPRSFLLFAASDGGLAVLTLFALLSTPARR
jgi:thiol:disulfide interchange protein